MAGTKNRSPFIQSANKASAEARKAFEFDLDRRLQDQGQILTADDMAGLYDPRRGLFTTIDGQPRMLTLDDLVAFRAAVHDIQRRHGQRKGNIPSPSAGGILPKQVIDLSALEDRQRASTEIHTVIPVSNRGGVVHIQTNAGPGSEVRRHHVMVQFMGYDAALAAAEKPLDAARAMLKGKVKFDCDCGRHTFWFRYIATIGNFNYGRAEDGYPRVRNPKLRGIACKHVLRVMATINQGATFNLFAARMIETGRRTLSSKCQIMTVAQQQEFIDNAIKSQKSSKRSKTITTTDERRAKRQAQPSYQRQQAERAKIREANERLRQSKAHQVNRKVPDEKKIQMLMSMGYSRNAALAAIAAADQVRD